MIDKYKEGVIAFQQGKTLEEALRPYLGSESYLKQRARSEVTNGYTTMKQLRQARDLMMEKSNDEQV